MSNSPGSVPPAPPSFEKRLPLALALMMLVLLAWQYFFKPAPAPKPVAQTSPTAQVIPEKPRVSATQPTPESSTPAAATAQIQASSDAETEFDSDLYHIVFSNRGAIVKSWVLKKFKDDAGK